MPKVFRKNFQILSIILLTAVFTFGCNTSSSINNTVKGDAEATKAVEEKKEQLVWDAGSVQLELEKLANGVYTFYPTDAKEKNPKGYPVATSGGFVVGDSGVLVIESMVNKRLADQVISFVRKVTDKPILYVVNTSYHGDHSYGNYVFPKHSWITGRFLKGIKNS